MGRHSFRAHNGQTPPLDPAAEPGTEPSHEQDWTETDPDEAGLDQWGWEDTPPVTPLWRSRVAVSAVLLLAVIAGTWWLFRWLTSPVGAQSDQPGEDEQIELEHAPDADDAADQSAQGEQPPAGKEPSGQSAESQASGEDSAGGDGGSGSTVMLHVAGEVQTPGVVEVQEGSRVVDALSLAGGATDAANIDALNLAETVQDGQYILVPHQDEEAPEVPASAPDTGSGAGPDGPGTADSGGDGAGQGEGGVVNLNTATSEELQTLSGIGPALAERIIDHRESVGAFSSMEDFNAVSGIGPAMMEKLDGQVSW